MRDIKTDVLKCNGTKLNTEGQTRKWGDVYVLEVLMN